jgi:hypothetical protein
MSTSDALAVLGAATGIIGTTLGVIAFVRDRARLFVRIVFDSEYLAIYVVNAGRQPVAIVQVELRQQARPDADPLPTGGRDGNPDHRGWLRRSSLSPWPRTEENVWVALTERSEPLVLQPGGLARFVFNRPVRLDWLHVVPAGRRPSRRSSEKDWVSTQAVAWDIRGRRIFSREAYASPGATQLHLAAGSSTVRQGD